jgi:DNA-binding NarL/FixJ family response regulator
MTQPIGIFVMSASPDRLDWLKRSLSGELGIRVLGRAPTLSFLRSLLIETPADLVVIDVAGRMESSVVKDWLTELTDLTPILLLVPERDAAIFDVIWNGNTGGILSSDVSNEILIQAIKAIASGLMVFDRALISQPLRETEEAPLTEPLTPREREVLSLLADGLANKEIALRLNISEHTIKFHIRSILGKLGASSRTEAVRRGLRSGLIEL